MAVAGGACSAYIYTPSADLTYVNVAGTTTQRAMCSTVAEAMTAIKERRAAMVQGSDAGQMRAALAEAGIELRLRL